MNEKLVAYDTNKGVTWEKNELAQKRLIRFFSEINQIYGRNFIFSWFALLNIAYHVFVGHPR